MINFTLIDSATATTLLALALPAIALAVGDKDASNDTANEDSKPAKVWAVQINVTDIDESIKFYTEVLGLTLGAKEYHPTVVSLNNGSDAHILLYQVDNKTAAHGEESMVFANWQVADLQSMHKKFKAHNIQGVSEINEFVLGHSFSAQDPSGNYMHVLELDKQYGETERTKLFNIHFPITDKNKALEFYGKLGIKSMTDNYWPPVVPVIAEGMEFILHKADETQELNYPDYTGAYVIFEVEDIEAKVKELEAQGLTMLYDEIQTHSPVGKFTALRDPFGQVVELIQPVRTPFDDARDRLAEASVAK